MRIDTVLLRPPEIRDAERLARLLAALGHPAEPAEVAHRLAELAERDPAGFRAVAEADGEPVGFVAAHLTPMLHRARPVGRVTTLVVDEEARGSGVGSFLLAAAESWCRERGATRIELTSGDERPDAHRFYQGRGWRREGARFVREE
jgi:GNAT superfamily N-acetyltransferase